MTNNYKLLNTTGVKKLLLKLTYTKPMKRILIISAFLILVFCLAQAKTDLLQPFVSSNIQFIFIIDRI